MEYINISKMFVEVYSATVSQDVLRSLAACGKNLFLWHEVLVLIDGRLFPEVTVLIRLCPGWEG